MSLVRLRGRGSYLDILLDDKVEFGTLEADLRAVLQRIVDRMPGFGISITVGRRVLQFEEMARLKEIVEKEYRLTVAEVRCQNSMASDALARRTDLPVKLVSSSQIGGADSAARNGSTVLRGTRRSGSTVHHEGDLVILGDGNPGADISATGDIVVYGALRGVAHAGSSGETGATILALSIRPIQLKIGPLSDGERAASRKGGGPQVAHLKEGQIVVEPYTPLVHWSSTG